MNCISYIIRGYRGVFIHITTTPTYKNMNVQLLNTDDLEKKQKRWVITLNKNYGFSCKRERFLYVNPIVSGVGQWVEDNIVTFESFLEPLSPTEEEINFIRFLTQGFGIEEETMIELGCSLVRDYLYKTDFEIEKFVREKLKSSLEEVHIDE